MKNNRVIGILAALIFILFAVIFAREYFPKENTDLSIYQSGLNKVNKEQVSEITLESGAQTLTLTKILGNWLTEDEVKVDSTKVDELLDQMLLNPKVQRVSDGGVLNSEFGFSESSSGSATFKVGAKAIVIDYGGQNAKGRYVKFSQEKSVYLLTNLKTDLLTTEMDAWINKQLISASAEEIERLSLVENKNRWIVTQNQGKWYLEGASQNIDQEKIKPVLETVQDFEVLGLAPKNAKASKGAAIELSIKLKNANEVMLALSEYQDDKYLVTSTVTKGTFLVSKATVEKLKINF